MLSDSSVVEASDMAMAQYQKEIECLYREKNSYMARLKQLRAQIESRESQHQQLLQDEIAISAECGQYEAQQQEILQKTRRRREEIDRVSQTRYKKEEEHVKLREKCILTKQQYIAALKQQRLALRGLAEEYEPEHLEKKTKDLQQEINDVKTSLEYFSSEDGKKKLQQFKEKSISLSQQHRDLIQKKDDLTEQKNELEQLNKSAQGARFDNTDLAAYKIFLNCSKVHAVDGVEVLDDVTVSIIKATLSLPTLCKILVPWTFTENKDDFVQYFPLLYSTERIEQIRLLFKYYIDILNLIQEITPHNITCRGEPDPDGDRRNGNEVVCGNDVLRTYVDEMHTVLSTITKVHQQFYLPRQAQGQRRRNRFDLPEVGASAEGISHLTTTVTAPNLHNRSSSSGPAMTFNSIPERDVNLEDEGMQYDGGRHANIGDYDGPPMPTYKQQPYHMQPPEPIQARRAPMGSSMHPGDSSAFPGSFMHQGPPHHEGFYPQPGGHRVHQSAIYHSGSLKTPCNPMNDGPSPSDGDTDEDVDDSGTRNAIKEGKQGIERSDRDEDQDGDDDDDNNDDPSLTDHSVASFERMMNNFRPTSSVQSGNMTSHFNPQAYHMHPSNGPQAPPVTPSSSFSGHMPMTPFSERFVPQPSSFLLSSPRVPSLTTSSANGALDTPNDDTPAFLRGAGGGANIFRI